jgi:hypothetical protein
MDVAKELIAILGGTTAAVAAIAWLAKSLLTHVLSKDIDTYKIELSAKYDFEVERLRAELSKQALEHEIKYRRVDEKVAKHLEGTYRHLFRFYKSVSDYVKILEWSGEPSKEEKLKTASNTNRAFWDYFLENRIYIPPRFYERIQELARKLNTIASDFAAGQRREARGVAPKPEEDYWPTAFDAVEEEATPLFTEIVLAVQKRLGVQDDDTGTSPGPDLKPEWPTV